MNVKELWMKTDTEFSNPPTLEWAEKFAELIVKECINEIHVADVGDLKAKGYYLDKVAEHIEKHFGVEE